MKRLVILLALVPTLAWTAPQPKRPTSFGTLVLASGQATTGISASAIDTGVDHDAAHQSLIVLVTNTTGSMEGHLQFSCDGGTTWVDVKNSTVALATATDSIEIDGPQCGYAFLTTTCPGDACHVTVTAVLGPLVK